MMNTQKTGSFIAQLRRERGLTQEQLAQKLGVTNRSISRWENGNTMPDLSLMQYLCKELEITIPELLTGERKAETPQWKKGIQQLMELARREQREKAGKLNLCFGTGFLLLLLALLLLYLPEGEAIVPALYSPYGKGVLLGLGICMAGKGFYLNNQYHRFTGKQIEVMTMDEHAVAMTTAEEMLQFARKHQPAGQKQYRLAFEKIAETLRDGEYCSFSFVSESYSINHNPGPWHSAVAVTNQRILLCGEAIRGPVLTHYVEEWYDREEILSVNWIRRKLVIKTKEDTLTIQGEKLEAVWSRLQDKGIL